jgi:hypothetical protein
MPFVARSQPSEGRLLFCRGVQDLTNALPSSAYRLFAFLFKLFSPLE